METATQTNLQDAVAEAKQALQDAQQRQQALAKEQTAVDQAMTTASRQAARERAESARRGESTASVSADLDLESYRERQREIPLEKWAAELAVEEAKLALYDAEDRLAVARHQEATARLQALRPEFDDLKQRFDQARAEASRDPVPYHRTNLRKDARAKLQSLETSYPGAE